MSWMQEKGKSWGKVKGEGWTKGQNDNWLSVEKKQKEKKAVITKKVGPKNK